LGQSGEIDGLVAQGSLAQDHAATQIIKGKEVGRDQEASPVTLAAFGVDRYPHEPPFVLLPVTLLPGNADMTGSFTDDLSF
jgi:hypothetical protein